MNAMKFEKLENDIFEYIQKFPIELYWDYREKLSHDQILRVWQNPDTLWDLESELFDMNWKWIADEESIMISQLQEKYDEHLIDFFKTKEDLDEWWQEVVRPEISVDLNLKQLINNTPDQLVLIKVHSNYDCINSWNNIDEPENYLSEVYKRVKDACKKEEYLEEFANTYTAELLCFVGMMSIEDIIELAQKRIALQNEIKGTDKKLAVKIAANTLYGFFGEMNGSGSQFESYTTSELILTDDPYDGFAIELDREQSYSMNDTYGGLQNMPILNIELFTVV